MHQIPALHRMDLCTLPHSPAHPPLSLSLSLSSPPAGATLGQLVGSAVVVLVVRLQTLVVSHSRPGEGGLSLSASFQLVMCTCASFMVLSSHPPPPTSPPPHLTHPTPHTPHPTPLLHTLAGPPTTLLLLAAGLLMIAAWLSRKLSFAAAPVTTAAAAAAATATLQRPEDAGGRLTVIHTGEAIHTCEVVHTGEVMLHVSQATAIKQPALLSHAHTSHTPHTLPSPCSPDTSDRPLMPLTHAVDVGPFQPLASVHSSQPGRISFGGGSDQGLGQGRPRSTLGLFLASARSHAIDAAECSWLIVQSPYLLALCAYMMLQVWTGPGGAACRLQKS